MTKERVRTYTGFGRPETRARVKALMERGIGTRGDLEMRFGDHLSMLVSPNPT